MKEVGPEKTLRVHIYMVVERLQTHLQAQLAVRTHVWILSGIWGMRKVHPIRYGKL